VAAQEDADKLLKVAEKEGCHQCLWLYGPDHEITEVGAMNIFVLLKDKAGGLELVTPPISSQVILPGVTRRSIVEMVSEWGGITVNEDPSVQCTYDITIPTKWACVGAAAMVDGGLSGGSIFLITFFSVLFVYCVGGVVYMKKAKGTEGMTESNSGSNRCHTGRKLACA